METLLSIGIFFGTTRTTEIRGGDPSAIIRDGDWKLIHYWEDGQRELYNTAEDPQETRDVSDREPDRVAELARRLQQWLTEVNATIPKPDPRFDERKHARRKQDIAANLLPKLERRHAAMLLDDFQPGADWWGSRPTAD